MDTITSERLPQIVQDFLVGQCTRKDLELGFKITCSGSFTQLTLTWTPCTKNSPIQDSSVPGKSKPKGFKRKTPSDKRRDNLRKLEFIEKKKQNVQTSHSKGKPVNTSKLIIPTPDCVLKPISESHKGTVTRSMAKLAKQRDHVTESPETGRTVCTCDSEIFSPGNISVESIRECTPFSPLCNTSVSTPAIPEPTDCDHEHVNTAYPGNMHPSSPSCIDNTRNDSAQCEPNDEFDLKSALRILSEKFREVENDIKSMKYDIL